MDAAIPTAIGALNEKPLHLALKTRYAQPGDRLEAAVGRYIVDILRGDLVIEIQTSTLAAIRRKLAALLEHHDVLLVVPVPVRTSIVRIGDGMPPSRPRMSPRRGSFVDVFDELVSIPDLIVHPRFALEVALVHQEEVRRPDARQGWRRHGWVIDHRRLIDIEERVRVGGVRDLVDLLPKGLPEPFTTADLAHAIGRPRPLAQRMAYCLARAGAVAPIGRSGVGVHYVRVRLDG